MRPARLPFDLCRYIVCLVGNDGTESQVSYWSNETFEWPVKPHSRMNERQPPASNRPPSIPTMHATALVSKQFWEITSELLYNTIYIYNLDDARLLVASSRMLQKWTKHMIVAPFFPEAINDESFHALAQEFGRVMVSTIGDCKKLESLVIRAYSASQSVTSDHWRKIYKAIPCGCKHLEIYDERFFSAYSESMELWEPRHLVESNSDHHLSSLRLIAVYGMHDYTFTNITRLSLMSWPIATNWVLPELTSIYITYLANQPIARSFWLSPKPKLKLLHFGYVTDLEDFKDFSQLVSQMAPNLCRLIYYHYGDIDMPWDPAKLPASLKEVTVIISHFGIYMESRRKLLETEEVQVQGVRQLTVKARQSWVRLAVHVHLARYHDTIRPTVVIPHDALCINSLGMVYSILTMNGADVVFSLI